MYTSGNKGCLYSRTAVRVVYGALAVESSWTVRLIKCNHHGNIPNCNDLALAGQKSNIRYCSHGITKDMDNELHPLFYMTYSQSSITSSQWKFSKTAIDIMAAWTNSHIVFQCRCSHLSMLCSECWFRLLPVEKDNPEAHTDVLEHVIIPKILTWIT